MNTDNFDYDAIFRDVESIGGLSNNSTSPPTTTTENDSDSGIAYTPQMTTGLEEAIINFDNNGDWLSKMNIPSPYDPSNDFNEFMLDSENPITTNHMSTYDSLFSDLFPSEQPNQELSQEIPSPDPVVLLSQSANIPQITNCFKTRTYGNTVPNQGQCVKIEPKANPTSITIIKTSKPITFSAVPIIQKPVTTNDSTIKQVHTITAPIAKRRRSDSPKPLTEIPTLTFDQVKLQYGNLSDDALKKHIRMIKNRESASLSRKRRKDLMENLDVKVKELTDENEELKKQKSKLLTHIQTLEMENKILRQYGGGGVIPLPARKPLILMGIVLLVVFNIFTIKSLSPVSNNPSNPIALYNGEESVVRGRTILSNDENSYLTSSDQDYGPNGISNNPAAMPAYPFIQCVAYINKTHSQRINQDLHSWVQDNYEKQQDNNNLKSVIIPDSKSLTIASNSIVPPPKTDSSIESQHHIPRKVALHQQRQIKIQSESKGQLQPYKTYEANYDEFIHTLDRRNDTLYFVSFKRDNLILPATEQNQTQRPKLSLILPASMANLNKSIHVPTNHVPMIKIDCEVEDTKLVFVQRAHIPSSYRNDLFHYYASAPQATI